MVRVVRAVIEWIHDAETTLTMYRSLSLSQRHAEIFHLSNGGK
jgi:hypothetical protein